METRARGRRAQQRPVYAEPRESPGRAHQNRSSQADTSQYMPSQPSQQSQPPQSQRKHHGLGVTGFARRGARATSRTASIASIPTVVYRPDEETVLGDGESVSEMPPDDGFAPSDDHGDDGEFDEEERTTKFKIMELSLDDLTSSTQELMDFLTTGDFDDAVFRGRLKIKKKAFDSVRESFAEETTAPYIDWAQVHDMWNSPEDAEAAAVAMVRANVATALYEVTMLQTSAQQDRFPLLDRLNFFFHLFFLNDEEMHLHPQFPELLLDIRTWYLIESLDKLSEKPNILKQLIASVFCEPAEDVDIFKRLASGPYKSLGVASEDVLEQLVSDRIQDIVRIAKEARDTYGIPDLKETFPLETLLEQMGSWLMDMFGAFGKESQSQTQGRSGHNLGDEFEDSQTTISESQPIARLGGNEPSLFVDGTSVNYVNSRAQNGHARPPPSNQQQMMPPPNAPRDYREHTTSQLLDSPAPKSSYNALAWPPQPEAKVRRIQLPPSLGELDDEDEEEDEFETDTRQVAPTKRKAVPSSMPPPKRARSRVVVVPQSSPPRTALPSSSSATPSSPAGSRVPTTSQPSRVDFDTLRQAKEHITHQARMTLSPFVRQRHGWSHDDMLLLLRLIRDRHAAWAVIERSDNDLFEHPRNQQAYRDKARNMKVDYLLTDAVLPPCFDLVALGKKEIDRLISLGKNPYRKEDDVDQDGQAVNTEYVRD